MATYVQLTDADTRETIYVNLTKLKFITTCNNGAKLVSDWTIVVVETPAEIFTRATDPLRSFVV